MPLSKAALKFIRSLSRAKKRDELNLFAAEGEKIVSVLLQSDFSIHSVYCTHEWKEENSLMQTRAKNFSATVVTEKELSMISSLKSPNKVLAVAEIKREKVSSSFHAQGLSVYLDAVRDPGNMGTLIRIADWFGVEQIIVSSDCADVFNPKVVQSAMGSLFRVKIFECDDPEKFFRNVTENKSATVYAAAMKGKNIYTMDLERNAILILGNESSGVNKLLTESADYEISIPLFPRKTKTIPDSLNVAAAGAIIISEFRRQIENLNGGIPDSYREE